MDTPSFTQKDLDKMPKDKLVEMTLALLNNQTELMNQVSVLTEEIRVMNQRKYGRKTESVSALQLSFDFGFNEAEAAADESVPEPAIEETTRRAHTKKKGKRDDFLGKFTEHRDISVEMDKEKLDRMFGEGNYKQVSEELVRKLEHHPESFEVVDYHIAVYARKDFTVKGDELDEGQSIVRAPRPAELWQHSYVTPSLLSSILFAKYVNAVPLYRQEQAFAGSGIDISRVNMANWIIKVSELYLSKYYNVLHEKLQEQKYIHADETVVQVNKEKELGNKKQYMWVYRTEPLIDGPQIVLYDYRPGRRAEYCGDFLQHFSGMVTTDGYEAYHKLARENASRFKVAGCWAHYPRSIVI
jgi:transposase